MKYTIIHVNDRAKKQMKDNHKVLKNFNYVSDIKFFNGNIENASDVLSHKKIKLNTWRPYDGRNFPPLPGELGVWLSNINIYEYIVKNNIDKMLVLEDDVVVDLKFVGNLNLVLNDLPDNWDFLSLYYFENQNSVDSETLFGSKYIHKSKNQPAGFQAMIYSKNGAEKILRLVKRLGIQYTVDCFVFEQARLGFLNGYSIIPDKLSFIKHEYKQVKSLIDPENKRAVEV